MTPADIWVDFSVARVHTETVQSLIRWSLDEGRHGHCHSARDLVGNGSEQADKSNSFWWNCMQVWRLDERMLCEPLGPAKTCLV